MTTLSSKFSIYLRSSGASIASTVLSKASGFASIWLLNRILTKGGYGNYEFAFTIVSLLLLVGAGGLNHAVMYRLSRLDSPPEKLDGHDFAGAALGWSLLLSTLFAGFVFLGAPFVETLAGNEDLAFWVSLLAFLIPIGAARGVYQAWHEARQRIPESIFMGKMLPAGAKVLLLSASWMLWPTPGGVVGAIILSELIPVAIWYVRTPVSVLNIRGKIRIWDVSYSIKRMLTGGLNQTMKNADILMMGFLSNAEATAEYVIASRVAILLLIGHNILNNILQPRIGNFIHKSEWTKIRSEYDQVRCVSLVIAMLGASILTLFGKQILSLFGGYELAYPIMMIIVGAHIAIVSVGMCGKYLNIAGYAGWTLATTIFAFVINVTLNVVLIPKIGALGAAISTLLSYLFVNSSNTMLIYKLDGIKVMSIKMIVITASFVLTTVFSAFNIIGPLFSGILMILIFCALIASKINRLSPIFSAALQLKTK